MNNIKNAFGRKVHIVKSDTNEPSKNTIPKAKSRVAFAANWDSK